MEHMEFSFPLPPDFNPYGKWFVVTSDVNMQDLINSGPGVVVRMRSADAVRYVPPQFFDPAFIAGMISDAA